MYGIAKSQLITISDNKNGQVSSLHVFHFLWNLGGREASQSQTLSLSVFLMWVSSVIRMLAASQALSAECVMMTWGQR